MSVCRGVEHLLDLYREGLLTADRSAEVAAHLEACLACGEALAAERRLRSPAPRPPSGWREALRGRLGSAGAAPRPAVSQAALARAVLAAVAAAFLLALGALWPGPPSQRPASEPGLSIAEAP